MFSKKIIHCLFILFFTAGIFAQGDIYFGSTGQQKLLINPALCAANKGIQLQTLFSANGIFGNFPNGAAYTGLTYSGRKLGIGVSNIYFSKGNYYSSNQTALSLAYKFTLAKITIAPSLQASYLLNRSSDYFSFYPTVVKVNTNAFTLSSGILVDIDKILTLGAALYDINQPDLHVPYYLPKKLYTTTIFHLSILLFKNRTFNLQPYGIAKYQSHVTNTFEGGLFTNFKKLSIQTAYKRVLYDNTNDYENYLTVGASFTFKKLKLGYTYSGVINDDFGYHEVFLSLRVLHHTTFQRNLMLD